MSWQPKYTITNQILSKCREIGKIMGQIRQLNKSKSKQAKLKYQALEQSSHSSTSIEGNPLSLTDVKRLLKSKPKNAKDTEREVLNYSSALQHVRNEVEAKKMRLNQKSIEKIQALVVAELMDNPAHVGAYRQEPVVIREPQQQGVYIYLAPDAKEVQKLMRDLCEFTNSNFVSIDAIVLAALFHRQFVIIHPFVDGNGRTTRLLTTAVLGMAGFDFFEIYSFENYYNRNITRYFQQVGLQGDYNELRDEVDFTNWIEYFVDSILDELDRVRHKLISKDEIRLEIHHKQIVAYLEENGSIKQAEYSKFSTRSKQLRILDFRKLVKLGLIEHRGEGRGRYYVLASAKEI